MARKGLMRSIGEFCGHIARAVKSPADKRRIEVKREVEVEQRETSRGTVTLRRTTIEEVELPREERGG